MLERSLELILPPGSNLPTSADISWMHVLPSLTLGRVAAIGKAPAALLDRISERAGGLDRVTSFDRLEPGEYSHLIFFDSEGISNFLNDGRSERTIGIFVSGSRAERRRFEKTLLVHGVGDRWRTLVVPVRGSRWRGRAYRMIRRVSGRLRRILPNNVWRGHLSEMPFLMPLPAASAIGSGLTVSMPREHFEDSPPRYLRDVLSAEGIDISESQWSLSPARGFPSQKVVISLRGPDHPDLIVKMTQAPAFNHRLHAEATALAALGPLPLLHLIAPEPVLTAEVGGLVVHAQTRLSGRPFRQAAEPSLESVHLAAAADALAELARLTRQDADSSEVSSGLADMLDAYQRAWNPPPVVARGLEERAARLGEGLGVTVFTHGDLGIWNLLIEPDRRIGALDWENSDPRGVPLWDLFELVRTFGVLLADSRGAKYGPGLFRQQLLEESRLSSLFRRIAFRQAEDLGIDSALVPDLFALCWVQNANREAATRPAPSWPQGTNNAYLLQALDSPFGA